MRSLLRGLQKQKGFTIVELLIVIVIIGILATLVIVTFSGIQQRARDTQRQTDINAVQSQVEAYYAQTGNYPTLEMVMSSTFRNANMKGFPSDALSAPNSATAMDETAATTGKYQYEAWTVSTIPATAADCSTVGAVTAATTSTCQSYRISAVLENGGTAYAKSSN